MRTHVAKKIRELLDPTVYEIGFAFLGGLLASPWEQYPFGISLARKLDDVVIDGIVGGPTVDYYHLYNNINQELNEKVLLIAQLLKSQGIDALPIRATVDETELDKDYEKTLWFPFSHKLVATRSGLGWIGKTDLLVTRRFGPRVRLASVVMSQAVEEVGLPITESECGNCRLCVDKCPARAANGTGWNTTVDRDVFYDPFKCKDYARSSTKERISQELSICGICIAVCPKGRN